MTLESYWHAVLHEVLNKENTQYLFRYTSVGPKPPQVRRRRRHKKLTNLEPKKQFIVGEPYPAVYFTQREYDCIMALLCGLTVKQVAMKLDLSPRTVEYYIKNLKTKLGCQTRSELLGQAIQTELIKRALAQDAI